MKFGIHFIFRLENVTVNGLVDHDGKHILSSDHIIKNNIYLNVSVVLINDNDE